jgi:type IV pilus assembly protein PilE
MRKARGFTLLELMIVVVIVAIIAAIAVASYAEQVRKGRRAEATRAVGELQLNLERWRAEHPCYGQSGSGGCPTTFTASGTYPVVSTSSFYTIAIATATPAAYSITATPAGVHAGDRCGVLTATRDTKPSWANTACN